ncbi:MAG: ABC transporter permease subunit [Treponema sp.]|nr:ABC transporter permease subunit [Treponema sp.]
MINKMQTAIIRKDIHGIAANKRMLSVLLVVPLVMTVFIPSVFVITMHFSPENEILQLAQLLDGFASDSAVSITGNPDDSLKITALKLILNYIMPLFFLLIPIMASSVMAASAFVGEKEKKTLETLLYCPLTLKEIFIAKIFAAFLLSMAVSVFSFIAMIVVFEIEVFFTAGILIMPDIGWLFVILLVAPAVALLAINIIVLGSAKAQSMEESLQRSVFLVLPVVMLIAGQFTGIMLLSSWLLLALGIVLAAAALFLLKGSFGKFQYETLLR